MRIFLFIIWLGFSMSVTAQSFTADFGKCKIRWLGADSKDLLFQPNISKVEVNEKVVTSSSGRFILHYFTSGIDSLPFSDLNNNLINDYIDTALVEIENIFDIEVIQSGLTTTNLELIHIYFRNIGYGYYGQTSNDPEGFIGNNPYRSKSYIEINNNIFSFATQGMDMIRVTLAHEFQHVLHMKYGFWIDDDNNPYFLPFYEMAATYFEESIYNSVNDYYHSLTWGPFYYPNSPPFYQSYSYASNAFIYGSALFFIYIENLFGSYLTRQFLADVNKNLTTTTPLVNVKTQFDTYHSNQYFNLSFNDYFNQYALALANTGNNPSSVHFFAEGQYYPQFSGLGKSYNTITLDNITTPVYKTIKTYKSGYSIYWIRSNNTDYPLVISNGDYEYYNYEGIEVKQDSLILEIKPDNLLQSDFPFSIRAMQYPSSRQNQIKVCVYNPDLNLTNHIQTDSRVFILSGVDVEVFPNPVVLDKHHFISVKLSSSSSDYKLSLFESTGNLLFQKIISSSPKPIIYSLPTDEIKNIMSSGVYILLAESSSNKQIFKVTVIK